MTTLRKEVELRAHLFEGQGDGIYMVTIRMDEISAAVKAWLKAKKKKVRK